MTADRLSPPDRTSGRQDPASLRFVARGLDRPRGAEAPFRVFQIDARTDARWPAFVAAHPDGLAYQHPAWALALEDAYGCTPAHLACEDPAGQLQGVLPLVYQRGVLSGRRLTSLPHTPVCGPLATSPEATAALLRAAVELARADPGLQLQIKGLAPDLDRGVGDLTRVAWDPTFVLDLPAPPEAPRFHSPRQRRRLTWAVNKATKHGVRLREAESMDDLRAWYLLYLDTLRRQAVPPRSFRFFEAAWHRLRPAGLLRLVLAEQGEPGPKRMLAGSVFLPCARTTLYAYTGYRRDTLDLRANDLIQWSAIHEAWERGQRRFDFGEVAPGQDGLAEFKGKWGAEPQPMYRYYCPVTRDVTARMAHPDSRIHMMMQATWRRLPLGVTEQVGGWLYQHL